MRAAPDTEARIRALAPLHVRSARRLDGSLIQPLARDYTHFVIARVITGFGIGAGLAIVNTFIGEMASRRSRVRHRHGAVGREARPQGVAADLGRDHRRRRRHRRRGGDTRIVEFLGAAVTFFGFNLWSR
jgi:hypothetical protein